MKILIISDSYLPGTNGIVKQILTIKEELLKRGHQITILAPSWGKKQTPTEKDTIYVPSIKFFLRPNDRITTSFHPKAKEKLMNMEIDIIHSHQGTLGYLGTKIAKEKGIPQVATQHTSIQEYVSWVFPRLSKFMVPLTNLLTRNYFNQYDTTIAPSQKAYKVLENAKISSPIKLIHNGIKLNLFNKADPKLFLKKYDLKKEDPLLVLVGRIEIGKNVDLAVKALKKVKKEIPNVKLAIIGDGNLRKSIDELIKELNLTETIFTTGFIDQQLVASANKAATLPIMTSDSDTLPTVALEAIACGKPMVAVHDEAIIPIIMHNKNGILTPKNSSKIAEAIISLLKNPNLIEKYSQESQKHAKKFSIETYTDQIEELYKNLIDQKTKK